MENLYDFDGVVVRKSIPSDIENLELKESDVQEIWNSHNHSPKDALRISLKESVKCFTILDNGEAIALFGICPYTLIGSKASIWMLSSSKLKKRAYRLVKYTKMFLGIFLELFPYLENWVSVDNKDSLDWLRRAGAKIEKPIPYGIEGKMFCHFSFSRN